MTDIPPESIRDVFVRAGWFEGRRVDVVEAVSRARDAGVRVSAENERWLQEYDGLVLEREGKRFELSRNAVDASSDDVIASRIAEEIGVPLLAVGFRHHATLFVEDSGAVWGCYWPEYGRMGDDIFDAADGSLRRIPLRRFDHKLPDTRSGDSTG